MLVFKIVTAEAWRTAKAEGRFAGAAIDLADGYIHLSTADQVEETARRHFSAVADLLLVAFDAEALGAALVFEPSRGGALFPHLYGVLDPSLALWAKPLPWIDGAHRFPEGWQA
jgi:uncharacterized protein (DUF952 family)